MTKAPYVEKNRLQDVIAALQTMAFNERSSLPPSEWATLISGNESKAAFWQRVFDDHSEFFRQSPDDNQRRYALVWRRALPRRFDRQLNRLVTAEEYAALTPNEKDRLSRPPISESQLKTLIDTAIALHAKAIEQSRDYRWWIPHLLTFSSAAGGAILGALLNLK